MAVLIIGAPEREKIAELKASATAYPVRWERHAVVEDTHMLMLKDRKPGHERPPSAHLVLPGGFRVAYSVEEQPAGYCAHLSISVNRHRKGMMPSLEAVQLIASEFGMAFPADKMWNEEFEPGNYAINLLELIEPREEGHA